MPKESVEIHLMINELQSRMSEERQEELLQLIESYRSSSGQAEENTTEQEETTLANHQHRDDMDIDMDENANNIVENGNHESLDIAMKTEPL